MLYALATVPLFTLLCFLLGLPLARLLLSGTGRSHQLFLAPALGFCAMITFIEITFKIAGQISAWWWAIWALAALGGMSGIALKLRGMAGQHPRLFFDERPGAVFAISALGLCAIFLMLLALPLVGDVSYSIFRTNPSDADVNITLADTWVNASPSDIGAFVASIGTPQQGPETIDLVSKAPISIFSARFIGTEVRLATSMMIGLYGELFRLPPYLAYFPLMLATAGITAITAFGMLRAMGASAWFALIVAASVIGGWTYMTRESDNSNQHATLPALAAALYLLYLRFDEAWANARIRSGIAVALTFAAAVTAYPEIGIAFGGALGAGLVIGGAVRRAGLDHWITTGVVALGTVVLLAVNGQAWILLRWVALVQSGALNLGAFTGPAGEYIETWGVVGVAGLPRMPFANVLLPVYAWLLLIGMAAIVAWRGWRSFTGLGVLIYAFGMCAIAAAGLFVAHVPYTAYRAASFLGFIALIACAAALYAPNRSQIAPGQPVTRSVMGASIFLALGVATGLQFWAGAFTQPAKGYSMMSRRDFKSHVSNLTGIRSALAANSAEGLAVYLPPMPPNTVPWWSTINAYMTAAPLRPVFLSGLMHDNRDARMPLRAQMYNEPEERERTITLLLVDSVHDPAPASIAGELIASDQSFRLYRIPPTTVAKLITLLPEPPAQ